jgi:hypothetical protein
MKWLIVPGLIWLLSGCGIRGVDTLPLPGGSTAVFVRHQTSPVGMKTVYCFQYDPHTGKDVLVRTDSSMPEKGIMDALKGLPVPVLIP